MAEPIRLGRRGRRERPEGAAHASRLGAGRAGPMRGGGRAVLPQTKRGMDAQDIHKKHSGFYEEGACAWTQRAYFPMHAGRMARHGKDRHEARGPPARRPRTPGISRGRVRDEPGPRSSFKNRRIRKNKKRWGPESSNPDSLRPREKHHQHRTQAE